MGSKRRGRGEGSIFQRADGVWCASISLGYDENGKRRQPVVYGKTKREAQEKLFRLQSDALNGVQYDPKRVAVREYLSQWLEDVARPSVRQSTYVRYGSLIRTHISPYLGGVQLTKLQPGQVQALYTRLEAQGASPRTREFVYAVLHKALDQAVKWGYIPRNVCDATEKPRVPKRPMKVLTPEEVARFLAAAKDDRLFALYLLAVTTGLRQGELLALHWEDVDLRNGAISVRHTLLELKGEFRLEEPKTAKGRRRVDLPMTTTSALREHRKRMMQEGCAGPWVFCDTQGGPLRRYNFLRRSFDKVLKAAEVPMIRFHDLRHTAATLLLAEGVHPKVVQERLGHAQISVTLDTYSHVLPSMQKEAAGKLDALLAEWGT